MPSIIIMNCRSIYLLEQNVLTASAERVKETEIQPSTLQGERGGGGGGREGGRERR